MDSLEKVTLDWPKKSTYISALLFYEERDQLRFVFLNNIELFAWSYSDMVGIIRRWPLTN